MTKKKVHLVLGSGGARGIAHIGVIESLEEDGYEIISVTGCSMGAIVGGMYCAGFLHTYKEWLLTLNKKKVFSLFDFTVTRAGFVKGDRILSQLRTLSGEQDIEHLKIPFTAVATDIFHRKEVHFKSGNLYDAMRASMGIPGVFTPVKEAGMYLVDGSVLNPLPLNLVNKKEDEMIVAVNLNGQLPVTENAVQIKNGALKNTDTAAWLKLLPLITKKKNNAGSSLINYSLFEILSNSYNLTQDRLTEMMIRAYPPDILIEIPRNSSSIFEFYRAKELIALGKQIYHSAINEFEKRSA